MARSPRDGSTEPHPRVFSVTTAHSSAADDQALRVKRYLITMGIRTACFVIAVVAQGAIRWTAVAGAVVLPYIAVVLANAVTPRQRGMVGAVTPYVDPTQRITDTAHVHEDDGTPPSQT
jgi:hypothetical protein